MSINNRKLQYLIEEVFQHINDVSIKEELEQIQNKEHYTLDKTYHNTRRVSTLENIYNILKRQPHKTNYNNHQSSTHLPATQHPATQSTAVKTCRSPPPPLDNSPSRNIEMCDGTLPIQDTESQLNIEKEDTVIGSISSPINSVSTMPSCKYLSELQASQPNITIIRLDMQNDWLSNAFFSALSNIFCIMNESDKQAELKIIKMQCIQDFNQYDYYKKYEYSTKHFKKIQADNTFANNLPITKLMLKIYGDILNVNVVYILPTSVEYITKFNPVNATVILSVFDEGVYTLTSTVETSFLRGTSCIEVLDINYNYKEVELQKLKLDELQNISRMKNLNIKTQGKTGKINIKKEQLIQNILKV